MAIPVFLINLDRSTERLRFMEGQAARAGVRFERLAAIHADALPNFLREEFSCAASLSPDEIACYASHLMLYQRIVRDQLPCAMILEDDVGLDDDLMQMAEGAISAAPSGWDYIHLSGLEKRAVHSIAALPNGRHLVRHSRLPMNTGGYLISCRGAQKLLKPAPRTRPIDQEIRRAWLRKLDVLGVHPPPVIWGQGAFGTTIDRTGFAREAHKRNWSAGFISDMGGCLYRFRKLGPAGYLRCKATNFGLAIPRRLKKLPATILLVRRFPLLLR